MKISSDFFKKLVKTSVKVIVTFAMVIATAIMLTMEMAPEDQGIRIFMIAFFFLPPLFFVNFEVARLSKHPKIALTFKIVRAFYFILLITAIVLLIWRTSYTSDRDSSIAKINTARITIDDVMGTNLPPEPNKVLNDSTITGFDVNNNGIRDDVELAIFEKYPDSAKIRAGMLQYAQALQLELLEVNTMETLETIMQKRSNARICIDKAGPEISLENTSDEIKAAFVITDGRKDEVENYVINTDLRSKRQTEVFEKYMTTYSTDFEKDCDINLLDLPN